MVLWRLRFRSLSIRAYRISSLPNSRPHFVWGWADSSAHCTPSRRIQSRCVLPQSSLRFPIPAGTPMQIHLSLVLRGTVRVICRFVLIRAGFLEQRLRQVSQVIQTIHKKISISAYLWLASIPIALSHPLTLAPQPPRAQTPVHRRTHRADQCDPA